MPEVVDPRLGDVLEVARMRLGQDPGLEWEPARVGAEGGEVGGVEDDPPLGRELLLDHVAVDAAASVVEELQGAGHLLPDRDRHDRRDDELAVGVLQAGAGGGADVLEEHAVDQPRVLLQVDQAVAVGPEDLADIVLGEAGHADVVARALDDDLVGADARHLVVDPLAPLVQVPLDLQGGELVGHDPDAPAGPVGARPAVAIGEDLGRGLVLLPLAEGAEPPLGLRLRLALEVVRPLRPLVRDDHPATDDRVLTQLGHDGLLGGR